MTGTDPRVLAEVNETKKSIHSSRDSAATAGSVHGSASMADADYDELTSKYEELLAMRDQDSFCDAVMELKKFVLANGLPENIAYGGDSIRAQLWKLFLGVPLHLDVEEYLQKLEDHSWENKVKEDAFRTFKKSEEFWSRISEPTLLRILNAAAADHGYVQGMNVLLGPFLLVMPELDSYYCFTSMLARHLPKYVNKNLDGAHRGVALANSCLLSLDPQLHRHIILKLRDMSIFSLRYVLTLMANVQPLSEVLRLWDAIFAFGVHFNIVVFCAHLILLRDKILAEQSSYGVSCVIQQGTLDSEMLIKVALKLVKFIPRDLFSELVVHCL